MRPAPLPGRLAIFWRLVGDLFKRMEWYKRGYHMVSEARLAPPVTLKLEMRMFALSPQLSMVNDKIRPMWIEPFRFGAAYDPMNDVLHIYR